MSIGVTLTGATFDEFVRSSELPVLADVWAPWCGPCKALDPVLAEVAAHDHRFVLASVDSDANPELTLRFGVMSVPTLLLLRGDELVWRSVGARGRQRLEEDLDRAFGYRLADAARGS